MVCYLRVKHLAIMPELHFKYFAATKSHHIFFNENCLFFSDFSLATVTRVTYMVLKTIPNWSARGVAPPLQVSNS